MRPPTLHLMSGMEGCSAIMTPAERVVEGSRGRVIAACYNMPAVGTKLRGTSPVCLLYAREHDRGRWMPIPEVRAIVGC